MLRRCSGVYSSSAAGNLERYSRNLWGDDDPFANCAEFDQVAVN
jgi:hypothetical protein